MGKMKRSWRGWLVTAMLVSAAPPAVTQTEIERPAVRSTEEPAAVDADGRALPAEQPIRAERPQLVRPSITERPSTEPPQAEVRRRIRVPLSLERQREQDLKIAAGDAELTRTEAGKIAVDMASDQEVALADKRRLPEQALQVKRRVTLPGIVLKSSSAGSGAAVRSVGLLSARPFIELAQAVRWQEAEYVAKLLLGLDPADDQQAAQTDLETPVLMRLSAPRAQVAPPEVSIESIGPKGYRSITVSVAPWQARQQQELRVHSLLGHGSFQFEVPRQPAFVRLSAQDRTLAGYGVEETTVHARLFAQDGFEVNSLAPLAIQLHATHGHLEPNPQVIQAGSSRTEVRYRPARSGNVTIGAEAGGLQVESVDLSLSFPWWAVGAAGAGGVLGGAARSIRRKRRPVWKLLLEGALVGALVASLSLALPELVIFSGTLLTTGLGLFVVSAAAGLLGTPLLESLAKKIFRLPTQGTPSKANDSG